MDTLIEQSPINIVINILESTVRGKIWRDKILANSYFLNFWMVKIGELTFASYLDGKTKTFGR